MFGHTLELELFGGLHLVDELQIPDDKCIAAFGDDEQAVIRHSMDLARSKTGKTQTLLAAQMGINKSQWSLLYDGQRGIPVGRFIKFLRATGSLALLKFYAGQVGCVLKTRREWGALLRDLKEWKQRTEDAESRAEKAEQRLAMYEDAS